jgi:hypothetical protein
MTYLVWEGGDPYVIPDPHPRPWGRPGALPAAGTSPHGPEAALFACSAARPTAGASAGRRMFDGAGATEGERAEGALKKRHAEHKCGSPPSVVTAAVLRANCTTAKSPGDERVLPRVPVSTNSLSVPAGAVGLTRNQWGLIH